MLFAPHRLPCCGRKLRDSQDVTRGTFTSRRYARTSRDYSHDERRQRSSWWTWWNCGTRGKLSCQLLIYLSMAQISINPMYAGILEKWWHVRWLCNDLVEKWSGLIQNKQFFGMVDKSKPLTWIPENKIITKTSLVIFWIPRLRTLVELS